MADTADAAHRPSTPHSDAFRAHQRFLWGLCYRLTGCAADADDLVQETFLRAMQQPPAGSAETWRPWLVRVAMNLGRDMLRRRKRRGYIGPWLPAPVETGDEESPPAYEPAIDGQLTTEGRYDLLESVSFAFLLALEALRPQQRAVLLLMDVFDYSVQETATALGISTANVKTTHHRARRVMQAYDRERRLPTREVQEQTQAALTRFVTALAEGDVAAIEALLTDSVRAVSDGAGEFFAARKPLFGPQRVARFHLNIGKRRMRAASLAIRTINGLPALVVEFHDHYRGEPPRAVVQCQVAPDGRIDRLYTIVATRKLTAIRFA
jgi:RNA polymerase sigma factor (sigma-70 family)